MSRGVWRASDREYVEQYLDTQEFPEPKEKTMFKCDVIFKLQDDSWSNAYTYRSQDWLRRGTPVIVQSGDDWYAVALVIKCVPDENFNPEANYKRVLLSLPAVGIAKEEHW